MEKTEIQASKTGLRFNEGKLKWGLMHYKSMEPMIRVLMYGAEKYDDWNWAKGLSRLEILECMQRHLAALIDAETSKNDKLKIDFKEDCEGCKSGFCKTHSGQPHIGHILCNGMFYSYFELPENAGKSRP